MPVQKIRYAVVAALCALVATAPCAQAIAADDMTKGNDGKRIKFYRNPMGLPDTSAVPKKDSMGMDYIPVYDDEDAGDGTLKISSGKIQKTGIRSEQVEKRVLTLRCVCPGRFNSMNAVYRSFRSGSKALSNRSKTSPQASTFTRASP